MHPFLHCHKTLANDKRAPQKNEETVRILTLYTLHELIEKMSTKFDVAEWSVRAVEG
jgi:hypothetical protein